MKEKLELMIKLARQAGNQIMKIYSKENIIKYVKEDNSPLTEADKRSNSVIIRGLLKKYPKIPVMSEENEHKINFEKCEKIWILDPLDGTKEFIKKNGEFSVNIAYVENKRPVIGVIFFPVLNELYYAIRNKGSFCFNGSKINNIQVSKKDITEDMVLTRSRSHASEKLLKFIEIFKIQKVLVKGSSLKGCLIAKGTADVYIRFGNVHEWDICAMDIIIKEAGGKITNFKDEEIKYNNKDTIINGFMVSNTLLHEKILQKVKNID
ncbi:3'(2'),5'-bisphosphate nucleotidase CysQ [archaeon]|jgi:3'(2'), 5'-bisphosphate nucleotidase|nr:3'(2'),5'-bisphosphate nucleotidase CysQ [archaeon]MBT4352356.1 3'(2'),5'-bisphosphate nucleotidase CysQ [archaeon]MBT4647049.1 3'(2'),5'-bisphosphate nucleotidase CysQ [archaeon]MBT6820958.1 3'(2'),5'-bisphosphate nucleotidase CysQ [archaeon]MBT7392150.1 3'(2'),5'-bisphosphate nucleotidase CysQ [archaeon]